MTYINTARGPHRINVKEELGAMLLGRDHEMQELAAWAGENVAAWKVDEEFGRSFSAEQRKKAAKEGASLPDGSFPIYSQEDVDNANKLRGKGGAATATVIAHIKKRVKSLGLKMPPSLAGAK
jgi:hypothetical protein